jgi:endonuclease/exonuclease/phosphatase family metal-dependent hydrolase
MSYNVNFECTGDPETLRAIEESEVDLVFLQEVNRLWEESLRSHLTTAYPHQVYYGDDGYAAGSAVMSKWSIESVEELPRVDWFPAARVVLETPIGRLQVLNVHLRPPRSVGGSYLIGHFSTPIVREREIRSYAAALDAALPTVVVGDFNEGDNGRAVRWLEALGYENALPQFDPSADTWRWRIGFVTLNGRYDHILYDDALEVLNAEVRDVGRSDHLPVIGVFATHARAAPLVGRERRSSIPTGECDTAMPNKPVQPTRRARG